VKNRVGDPRTERGSHSPKLKTTRGGGEKSVELEKKKKKRVENLKRTGEGRGK